MESEMTIVVRPCSRDAGRFGRTLRFSLGHLFEFGHPLQAKFCHLFLGANPTLHKTAGLLVGQCVVVLRVFLNQAVAGVIDLLVLDDVTVVPSFSPANNSCGHSAAGKVNQTPIGEIP